MVITDTYNNQNNQKDNRSELLKEINNLNEKLSRARKLLLNGDIDGSDYKTIKSETEHKLEVLEVKLADTIIAKKQKEDIVPIVVKAIEKLTRLDIMYSESTTSQKRELVGSMYPQKFTFEELQHRTAHVAKLYSFIYLINNELRSKKRRASDRFTCLPTLAQQTGFEPKGDLPIV